MNFINLPKKGSMKTLHIDKSLPFLSCICIIILSGCSRYQYISINSNLYQNEKKEFVIENDTALLKYTFAGENFPITISIFNKLQQPIYVDLGRSTVIINNFQINDPFYHDGQIDFIAPLSYVTLTSNPLKDQFINVNPQDSLEGVPIATILGKNHSFNEKTTPLYFRSILALTTQEDYTYPAFFDYSFWVSDILQTMTSPASMTYKPSNQFYIREKTGFGKSFGWIVLAALVIVRLSLPGQ